MHPPRHRVLHAIHHHHMMFTTQITLSHNTALEHSFRTQPVISRKAALQGICDGMVCLALMHASMQHALLMRCDEASNQVTCKRPLILQLCRACHLHARHYRRRLKRVLSRRVTDQTQRGVTEGNHLPAGHLAQGRYNH